MTSRSYSRKPAWYTSLRWTGSARAVSVALSSLSRGAANYLLDSGLHADDIVGKFLDLGEEPLGDNDGRGVLGRGYPE